MQIVPKVPLKIDLIISIFIYKVNNGTRNDWIIVSNSAENDLKKRGTLGAMVRFSLYRIFEETVILIPSLSRISLGVKTEHDLTKMQQRREH